MDTITTLLMAAIGSLSLAICFMFRQLVSSQDRRVTELAAAHRESSESREEAYAKLAEEIHSMWGAIDRMNRVGVIRICASAHIAPELKNDAADVLSEIDRESKKREPK